MKKTLDLNSQEDLRAATIKVLSDGDLRRQMAQTGAI
jgi:hypothetical protein